MANFRLQISSISRSAGRRATAAAAYRSGERIRDERSGELHNYSRREDVLHKEIMLPSDLAEADLDWARDRAKLWNTAEQAETRRTARVAREIQVTLPAELTAAQRLELARRFSQEVADRYHIAVDLAIHQPRSGSDSRNFHAHLLGTTREMRREGLGAKTGLDLPRGERQKLGLPTHSQEFTNLRERWAMLTNDALREAHIETRVDHRSLQAQGIDREPARRIPLAAYQIEKKGQVSDVAARMRAEHQARMQARLERATSTEYGRAGTAPVAGRQPEQSWAHPSTESSAQRSLDDIRRESREAWLRMRATTVSLQPNRASSEQVRDPATGDRSEGLEPNGDRQGSSRGRDDDHSI